MKTNQILMVLAATLLLLVDWLTFHDFFEPHTARDWLTLLASLSVFAYFTLVWFPRKLKV